MMSQILGDCDITSGSVVHPPSFKLIFTCIPLPNGDGASCSSSSSSSSSSVDQLQLVAGEGKHPADVVGDAEGEQGDDHQEKQHPPEAQVLHKLLPRGLETGQHTLTALQVGVQQGVALHRTAGGGGADGERWLEEGEKEEVLITKTRSKQVVV